MALLSCNQTELAIIKIDTPTIVQHDKDKDKESKHRVNSRNAKTLGNAIEGAIKNI